MARSVVIQIVIYIYVFILIWSSQPFYVWKGSVYVSIVGLFIAPLLWPKKIDKSLLLCGSLLFLCYVYFSFYRSPEAPPRNILGYMVGLFYPTIFFIKKEYLKKIFDKYFLFFSISTIPSLVVYFLVVWGDLSLPYNIIDPLNSIKDYNYLQYPFLVIPDRLFALRFCGYYDEPGVIGSIAGILLIINEWNLKDWKNWPILVAGIFSFSLFFYLLSIIYYTLFSPSRWGKLFFYLFIVSASIALYENDDMNRMIFSRIEIEDGKMSGDNRTTASFDVWYNDYLHSDMLFVGYGAGKSSIINSGGASYKDLLVDYGVVVCFIFYLTVIALYCLRFGKSKQTIICLFCFLAMMYQRPFIFNPFYLFLIMAPLCLTSSNRAELGKPNAR